MAWASSTTFPGATTFPGFFTPPVGEGLVPSGRTAPLGLPPKGVLLVKFTPPTGKGMPVVRECPDDLQFGSTAPGGFESMSCTIDWPDNNTPPPDALVTAATAQVIDGRNGNVVWHGHIVDPGFTKAGTGASHRVSSLGYYTVLDTQVAALAYVDRDLGNWLDIHDYPAGGGQIVDNLSLGAHSGDWVEPTTSVIEQTYPDGSKLDASTPSHMTMQYLPGRYGPNQDITMVLGSYDSPSSADFRIKIRVKNIDGTVLQTPLDDSYAGANIDWYVFQGSGAWTSTTIRSAEMRFEDYWLRWGNMAVVFDRVDRNGATVGAPSTYVTCADLVEDVIGRLLRSQLDISEAIAMPTTLVESAAWFGGISAHGVFDFVEDLEPDLYWAVWGPEQFPEPRFEYVPWRVRPRYLIPPDSASITLAGGGDDLANHGLVAYQTSRGVPASLVVSGDVPELTAAGVDRTMLIDLTGEGPLSKTTATSKGLDALNTANIQRTSGTATVTGPVFDQKEGRMIEPWEIRAGWPVVLAGGVLRADAGYPFSTTGSRAWSSSFRLTQVQYSASSASAELTLDGGGRNVFNRVRRPVPRVRKLIKGREPMQRLH